MPDSSMGSEGSRPATPRNALAELAHRAGELRASAANLPVELDGPDALWLVRRGALDVSVAEYGEGRLRSAFRHVLRIGPGRLAFGMGAAATAGGLKVVAKGVADTEVYRVPIDAVLDETARDSGAGALLRALAGEAESWIDELAGAVARDVTPRPIPALVVEPGRDPTSMTTGIVTARHGVVWLRAEDLDAAFLQIEEASPDGPGLIPVTREAWVELHDAQGVECISSRDLDVETLLGRALPEFHRLALRASALHRRLLLADEANLQAAHLRQRRMDRAGARRSLMDLSDSGRDASGGHTRALVRALEAVGKREGICIAVPASRAGGEEPSMHEILRASGVRARRVRLLAEDRWWVGDSGAMLAFRREDGHPLALLPGPGGRYRVLDAATGQWKRAGPGTTGEILEDAWLPYRTLPQDRPVGTRDVFAAGGANVAADLVRLASTGFAAGMLALAPAAGIHYLVGRVIPSGEPAMLLDLAAMLVAVAIMSTLFHMLRGTALMRLEGRMVARMSAALWDRLLRMRLEFFRGFTAGELATRAMAFELMRDRISGAVADALLSTVFLLPMFALLFWFDALLGWLALTFGLLAFGFMSVLAGLLVAPQRRYIETMQQLVGELLQFVNGIAKLRSCGAEDSAYAVWARGYREQKRAQMRTAAVTEHVTAFSAAFPALAGAALFAVALGPSDDGRLAPKDFLAVYVATTVFYMTVVRLGHALQAVATLVPGIEQVRPLVQGAIDAPSPGRESVALQGGIAFHRVGFRYSETGPMVLRNVSLHAGPGELVAIVGESGAGKSTLFHIALGLVEPTAGAVYFDGRDLAHMDRDSVRRQVGVVTQDGSLQGGTVLGNIIGVTEGLTIDDAWRAAREASVDRDIRELPMGMLTPVSESGATFSGGQQQRMRIAAALVHNPRLILLDEPTSWLDTKSQAETMHGIEHSSATRIVIAHRLSTIRKADRIYVLKDGSVVQTGGYEELLESDGPFRDMARRQLIS